MFIIVFYRKWYSSGTLENFGHKRTLVPEGDISKIIKFEAYDFDDLDNRIYDVVFENKLGKQIRAEFKNWDNFYPSTIRDQFVKDLSKMTELGEIKWFFKKSDNVNAGSLNEQIISSLMKQDGNPIDELQDISLDQVKNLLGDDYGKITQSNRLGKLLDALRNEDFFSSIFNIVD